jgi:hypothetical protein
VITKVKFPRGMLYFEGQYYVSKGIFGLVIPFMIYIYIYIYIYMKIILFDKKPKWCSEVQL